MRNMRRMTIHADRCGAARLRRSGGGRRRPASAPCWTPWRGPGRGARRGDGLTPPAPLDPATAAVLLTLVDHDTPLWLDPAPRPARDWIAFHCGAARRRRAGARRLRAGPGAARSRARCRPARTSSRRRAATLILQVGSLADGTRYRLSRPGLARAGAAVGATACPPISPRSGSATTRASRCGVDLVLCAGTTLAALPRSVTVEEA